MALNNILRSACWRQASSVSQPREEIICVTLAYSQYVVIVHKAGGTAFYFFKFLPQPCMVTNQKRRIPTEA